MIDMAKVSKKNMKKETIVKKSRGMTESSAATEPRVVYDDGDDEEEHLNEENISSEEEQEGEDGVSDERKRQKLLEAISALGGKRKNKLGERSEAAVHMSEFTVNADGGGDKVDLSDLIGNIDKTEAVPNKTKNQLKTLQQNEKTIETPLSKQESERIQRNVAFRKAATEVTQWKGIIQQNQRAEQLIFPLNQEPSGPRAMETVVTCWKAQTPLEQEIFSLLSANKQPVHNPILTPVEEATLKAMSFEEAKVRRAELQKARALQSYYEAKSRRERKIKSKKYHKVLNKAKRKDFLKQFEKMVKTDPAAALEELNKMELARMKERMSLKHQNSGKWAKSKAIMAKYDEGARKAMQQQLEVNKDLTQKLVTSLNNDQEEEEEEEEGGNPEVIPEFVNDAEQSVDSSNPWMRGKLFEPPTEREVRDTVDFTEEGPTAVNTAVEDDDEEGTEEERLLREFDHRRRLRQAEEADIVAVITVEHEEENKAAGACVSVLEEDEEENKASAACVSVLEEEEEEEQELSKLNSVFQGIANTHLDAEVEMAEATADTNHVDTHLEEGLMRIRTLEDVALLSQMESVADQTPVQPLTSPTTENMLSTSKMVGKNSKRKRGIELKQVLTKESKIIQVPLALTVEDKEDSDEMLDQRGLIKEAFAGDDVISDFLKDKRKQEDVGKPKVVDLTLPGWGEWGGMGSKPSRNKRRKFRIRTVPRPPRKDQHLPSVIISEKRNSSISLHQVNSLPSPFVNHTQFESTIRSPIGRMWNTEQTVNKITNPKVVTQLGAIIEPMAKEELMKNKKQVSTGNSSGVEPIKTKRMKQTQKK
ncbi:U3 small nucleolar RNA-associated protein 14-like A-like [Solea senegalensis]|uniref:U3 small nucleolar RNA-associated protein 14-like A-like n=1 Tax=Solea senegalensis TaxID=28829 RepID=A0AAV6RG64_SOLSE|nr:U3 small nucleolar RNA-associated protein 14 homolog A [Solea senegalensis]KAG7503277.1 U3 small nucleolar RNA-associated protein 14-like A-like [Solea senegalensis]